MRRLLAEATTIATIFSKTIGNKVILLMVGIPARTIGDKKVEPLRISPIIYTSKCPKPKKLLKNRCQKDMRQKKKHSEKKTGGKTSAVK